jgi:hypothetical protein
MIKMIQFNICTERIWAYLRFRNTASPRTVNHVKVLNVLRVVGFVGRDHGGY